MNKKPSSPPNAIAPFLNLFLCFLIVTAFGMASSLDARSSFFLRAPYVLTFFESAIYLFCAWWFFGFKKAEIAPLLSTRDGNLKRSLIIVAACAACYWLIESALLLIGKQSLGGLTLFHFDGFIPKTSFLAVMVLIGPFAEELLFRGYFQSRLTAAWGPTKAIIVASAVFGLMHSHVLLDVLSYLSFLFNQSSEDSIYSQIAPFMGVPTDLTSLFMRIGYTVFTALVIQGLSGALYGYLFYKTKSLWIPWIAHATHNLLVITNLNYENLEYVAIEILEMRGGIVFTVAVIIAATAGFVRALRAVR